MPLTLTSFRPATVCLRFGVQKKKWPPRRTATLVFENLFRRLLLKETPCHTERAKGRSKQHYRGAAVRNTICTWAKERPPGKAVILPGQSNIRTRADSR